MSHQPVVSIVMPVRGGAPFLKAALESLVSQRGVDHEIICVDDRACDSTVHLIEEFATRAPEISLVRNPGCGISDALNHGFRRAKGRYVARMDADDLALPGRLATQAAYLDAHKEVGVLGGQAVLIDAKGNVVRKLRVPVGSDRVVKALQTSCVIIHPTVMARREVVLEAGGYRRDFDGAEDYELWLRLRSLTKLDNLPQSVLFYRQHEHQVTQRRQFKQARLAALAVIANEPSTAKHLPWNELHDPQLFNALRRLDPSPDIVSLTACRLVDNGGTLRASGMRYLRKACQAAAARPTPEMHARLALACVRHQIQLARSGRWHEAVQAFPIDLIRWREKLLRAYVRQLSSLWPVLST